jgi:hypothetical protein
MTLLRHDTIRLLLLAALIGLPATCTLADGGAVRVIEKVGGLRISVFTSPVVLTAGEADVSVLVQDAASSAAIPNCEIDVSLTPTGRPYATQHVRASHAQATNQLFQASQVALEAGIYDLVVTVTAGKQTARVKCAIEVGNSPTKAAHFWPWFAWPFVPIVVFAASQWRNRR